MKTGHPPHGEEYRDHGDFDALLAALDSDVVLHVDAAAAGSQTTIRGARAVAANARMFSANARFAETALVDGAVGIVVAPGGGWRWCCGSRSSATRSPRSTSTPTPSGCVGSIWPCSSS